MHKYCALSPKAHGEIGARRAEAEAVELAGAYEAELKQARFETRTANVNMDLSVMDVQKGILSVPELCDKDLEVD